MKEVQEQLFALQDLKYRDFHSKLMPNISKENVIGIRVPVLRKRSTIAGFPAGTATSIL